MYFVRTFSSDHSSVNIEKTIIFDNYTPRKNVGALSQLMTQNSVQIVEYKYFCLTETKNVENIHIDNLSETKIVFDVHNYILFCACISSNSADFFHILQILLHDVH